MRKLFSIHPALAVCDMHPDYLSAHFARETGMEFIAVQHHHAHIASVMAEHSLAGPAIGIAFDGTGYGVDGNIWGGEILLCEGSGFIRMGHLSYVPMFGGENAARDAALCADSYLACAGMESLIEPGRFALMQAALKHRTGIFQSSSMGRLFDAVSSILEQKKYNSFEGECAIALENLAMRALEQGKNPYPLYFELREEDGVWIADQSALIRDILAAMQSGVDAGAIAAGFHRAIVWMVIHVCERLREQRGTHTVALSGGVFANRLLLEDCMDGLMKNGFIVFINQAVPMNDGGIALGQAFIASRRINERKSV